MGKWGTEEMTKDIFGEEEGKISREQLHEMKVELMRKYANEIRKSSYTFHIKGNIPSNKIDNAIASFAYGLDRKTIIGFYDLTIFSNNGKEGMVFTDDAIYYKGTLLNQGKMGKLYYSDVDRMADGPLTEFCMKSGERIWWQQDCFNNWPFREFMKEMLELERQYGGKGKKGRTKSELMLIYGEKIMDTFAFYAQGTIPAQKLAVAISTYAYGAVAKEVIGLFDTTVFGSGKRGYVFTEEAVYQNENKDGPHKLRYEDIAEAKVDRYDVQIEFKDGSVIKWKPSYVNVQPFVELLKQLAGLQE